MNSVIIPHLPPAPVAYHHKAAAAGYGYGIPAQGYLSYTPTTTQQQHGFHHMQPQQPTTTPTDVLAFSAMMQPRPQYFQQQKRQFEFPDSRESLFPGKSQQQQYQVPAVPASRQYQQYPAANRAPEVRTTSSTRPNRTKADISKLLFVDCSIEYDLPNVPKVSLGKDGKVEPILMVHPAYLKQSQSQSQQSQKSQQKHRQQSYPQPVACNVRDCQCQMVMVARQRQMLQQQQQQQFIRQQQQQQQQQVEATRKAVKRSYEANFQHQQTNMNAGKKSCEPRRVSKKLRDFAE